MLVAMLLMGINGFYGLLHLDVARAYGLITTRSIELNNSTNGATNTTYAVTFTPSASNSIQAIIVDFCSNDPIIGDSCTTPSSFTLTATPGVSNQSANISTYTTVATLNSNRTLELSGTAGAVSTAITFNITTVTNPATTNTTFYGRILTFDTTTHANSYTPTGANTGLVDAGGIALSTAANIVITSKVQEQLSFCVYTNTTCGGGGTTISLGDANDVLSSSHAYVSSGCTSSCSTLPNTINALGAKFDVQTNASNNAIIRIKGDTLKFGSTPITAIGSSATSSSVGTSQFGMCLYDNVASGATITPTSPYNNANCDSSNDSTGGSSGGGTGTAQFAYDVTTGGGTGNNITGTYGQNVASVNPGSSQTAELSFLANISTSQQAGIYTATLIFVATGTY